MHRPAATTEHLNFSGELIWVAARRRHKRHNRGGVAWGADRAGTAPSSRLSKLVTL